MNAVVTNIALESAKLKYVKLISEHPGSGPKSWEEFIGQSKENMIYDPVNRASYLLMAKQWGHDMGYTDVEWNAVADEIGVPAEDGTPPSDDVVRALRLDALMEMASKLMDKLGVAR